ncbi:bifunctional serine/threonine-protein kinase/formylglycine-generating enzyme family protein [Gimesia panareensis]|uniref:bifunctional serine/threonine-protein kinase/formylglycine-generating enzyme family protein n=1 Tax=Gimesia panareensis TaxID=2527978 RepID=UPI00118A226F|nr:bifunctional serine/threonine-protein kinase/formylglycine-generating enzyme family protein [Gimesia panareensis]QDU51023.1 Serine/threonine-protein kinase PrkC [Gimesia panareensis]
MKSRNGTDFEQLPSDLMLKINQLCDQFEVELRQGDLPSITDWLDHVAVEYREVILKELIPLEVEHRIQTGDLPQVNDYLQVFPMLDQEWLSETIATAQAELKSAATQGNSPASTANTVESYTERIVQSGVLGPEEMTEILGTVERPQSADELAELLTQSGRMTRYQSQMLLEPEGRPLLIGDYLILEPIGSGGMGTVYKAVHRRMKRIVALKVIRADLDQDPERLKRFEREVQTAARLSHPHIVTAYDAGEARGIHYLICEYIDGESLTQLVRDSGPLDFADAMHCLQQIAEGLEYAHAQGVIHRDIKPANILVDDQGDLKILDMGLARLQETSEDILSSGGQTELTSSQIFMGTIDYMAPEQARNTKLADHRSDIYSLGCTFYFLLTGKPVYAGETTVERILAHKEQPIPQLSTVNNQVPEAFNSIFETMLAKDPNQRYANVSELLQDLKNFNATYVAEQTSTLPVKDAGETTHSTKDWASQTTEVQPADSEYTVLAGADTQRQSPSAGKHRGLIWGGTAILAAVLIVALSRNPEKELSEDLAAGSPEPVPGQSGLVDGKKTQQEYAAKIELPVQESVSIGGGDQPVMLKLSLIPPGEFVMGTEDNVPAAFDALAHSVKLTRPFYIGTTEVTNQLFQSFVNETGYQTDAERAGGYGMIGGSWNRSEDYYWKNLGDLSVQATAPAVNISWNDAVAFCEWLSKKTGDVYRLPTEAEWEYACRAGTQTPWFFGNSPDEMGQYAWFQNNSEGRVYPAKQKLPNAFGLYDVYGNEWEWCQDFYAADYYQSSPSDNPTGPAEGSERVRRGGGFQQPASQLTSYVRGHGTPESPSRGAFRVVREIRVD